MMVSYVSAAVALNNIGVSLLEHGCYQQAMKTFKDALSVLRLGFQQRGVDAGSSSDASFQSQVASKLADAMKRLSSRQQSNGLTHQAAAFRIHCISGNDLARAVIHVMEGGPSTSEFFAIRIEDLDFEIISKDGADAECAQIVSNFALSYRCVSFVSTTSAKKSTQLVEGAIRLAHAAQTILENGQERATSPSQRDYLMHIEVLVLSLFMQMQRGSQTHYDRLVQLRSLVNSHGHELLYGSLMQRAAAAA